MNRHFDLTRWILVLTASIIPFMAMAQQTDDDENNTEAWSGFHAVNTMFVVTEASGLSEAVFNAIEGNLQGNSRLLLVFNPLKVF